MRLTVSAAVAALLATPGLLAAQRATPSVRVVRFEDVTAKAGITFKHQWTYSPGKPIVETLGSGVASLDYDNDGRQDLFLINGAPGSANALYRNAGAGTFVDVTRSAGVGGASGVNAGFYKTGVAVGDIDNDGDLDVYVTALGPNILYRNNGNGTFTEVTSAAGVAGSVTDWSTSAGFLDFDGDGDLDLYVANYLDYRIGSDPYCGAQRPGYRMYCSPAVFDGQADRLYRNNGNGTFTDVSRTAGIANPSGKGLGIVFCDVDQDTRPDIYVANDEVRNFLYHNNGDGTFKDVAYGAGVGFGSDGKPQGGMGTDCGDVDGDGRPDLFVTNFEDEVDALYRNMGGGLFQNVTGQAGLQSSFGPLGFGTKLFDQDNDGDLDIYVANGHVIDNVQRYRPASTFAQKPLFYENIGSGRFRDVSARSGSALQIPQVGRGLAVADFDDDGYLDVVVSNQGQAPMLLRNAGPHLNGWLTLRLVGHASNRFGLGARVEADAGGTRQVREVNNVGSYLSSNDIRLHLGFGPVRTIDRLTINWPSGIRQILTSLKVNQTLTIEEPSGPRAIAAVTGRRAEHAQE